MSARERLAKADELFEEALSVPLTGDDAPPEPEVTQIVALLAALVAMTGAHAAAVIEANEHPMHVIDTSEIRSETRPYAGG